MAEQTGIEWTDATFNPWIGCTKVSPGCDNCYAEEMMDHRYHRVQWGGERKRTSEANWRLPLRWNAQAAIAGVRRKVFCASLADVFDNQVPADWRADLWSLIARTPYLDWLLLTKRPQNIAKMLPPDWGDGWPHVWLGTTAENQEEADRRIPHLLAAPAMMRFLSCEPLLGPIDLRNVYHGETLTDALDGMSEIGVIDAGDRMISINPEYRRHPSIDWVIVGGESGPHARPMHPGWARSLLYECWAAGVPFFLKQLGEWAPSEDHPLVKETLPWAPENCQGMARVGKRRAGAMLDGREWREFPA